MVGSGINVRVDSKSALDDAGASDCVEVDAINRVSTAEVDVDRAVVSVETRLIASLSVVEAEIEISATDSGFGNDRTLR